MSMIYSLLAVGSATVAVAGPMDGNPYIQYGALGLCGAMVLFMCKHITETHRAHREEREMHEKNFTAERDRCYNKLETLGQKQLEAYEAIAGELRMRECLLDKTDTVRRLERALNKLDEHHK